MARPRPGSGPVHLLVDSTGPKLCGSGEWLLEKHGTKTLRSWRKLHIAVDADTGQIAATALTTSDVDDVSQVGPLLDQVDSPVASFTADGAYDRDGVYGEVVSRYPEASVIVPPRSSAVPSDTAQTAPTMRDRHLQTIAEHGRMAWQKASDYNWRALVEADISRLKRVIGDGLRSRTDQRRASQGEIAVNALNQMLELGHPEYVRLRNSEARWPNCDLPLTHATQSIDDGTRSHEPSAITAPCSVAPGNVDRRASPASMWLARTHQNETPSFAERKTLDRLDRFCCPLVRSFTGNHPSAYSRPRKPRTLYLRARWHSVCPKIGTGELRGNAR